MDVYGVGHKHKDTAGDDSLRKFLTTVLFSLLRLFISPYIRESVLLLGLGSVFEIGRRIILWVVERLGFQCPLIAQFHEGDPAYEWIVLFLTNEKIWHRSRHFNVTARNSKRKWGVSLATSMGHGGAFAEYVPTYEMPQLFRWNGYWVEFKRDILRSSSMRMPHSPDGGMFPGTISLTLYTFNMSALAALVEEARSRYVTVGQPYVTVHIAEAPPYGPALVWNNAKHKTRRSLGSVILVEGVIKSLVSDVQEFLGAEDWYVRRGIPHRRGYLLYGPPGTGKTSTIYALASELGIEIYTLSLSSGFVDDSFLQRAASTIPKNSIFLIEDIDCAFPARTDDDDGEQVGLETYDRGMRAYMPMGVRRPLVTLSGLLNVLDGVGSEEGTIFFATTNNIEALDPALLRPGRVDQKICYFLASCEQALTLFERFFGEDVFPTLTEIQENSTLSTSFPTLSQPSVDSQPTAADIKLFSSLFSTQIPPFTFSIAELQEYLIENKDNPAAAAKGVEHWVESKLKERSDNNDRLDQRKRKVDDKRKVAAVDGDSVGASVFGRFSTYFNSNTKVDK